MNFLFLWMLLKLCASKYLLFCNVHFDSILQCHLIICENKRCIHKMLNLRLESNNYLGHVTKRRPSSQNEPCLAYIIRALIEIVHGVHVLP